MSLALLSVLLEIFGSKRISRIGETTLQVGIHRLASWSRGTATARPVPGRRSGRERNAGVCADMRNATTGERPEVHGASRPAACQRTASRLDPYCRAVQPGLSRSRRIVRRYGEILSNSVSSFFTKTMSYFFFEYNYVSNRIYSGF